MNEDGRPVAFGWRALVRVFSQGSGGRSPTRRRFAAAWLGARRAAPSVSVGVVGAAAYYGVVALAQMAEKRALVPPIVWPALVPVWMDATLMEFGRWCLLACARYAFVMLVLLDWQRHGGYYTTRMYALAIVEAHASVALWLMFVLLEAFVAFLQLALEAPWSVMDWAGWGVNATAASPLVAPANDDVLGGWGSQWDSYASWASWLIELALFDVFWLGNLSQRVVSVVLHRGRVVFPGVVQMYVVFLSMLTLTAPDSVDDAARACLASSVSSDSPPVAPLSESSSGMDENEERRRCWRGADHRETGAE